MWTCWSIQCCQWVPLIKWSEISSLFDRGNHFSSLMFLRINHGIPNHSHTQSYIMNDARPMLKYTNPYLRIHSDLRSRDSSIIIAWETLMAFKHLMFSWTDRSNTLSSNMYLCPLLYISYPITCKTCSSQGEHTSLWLLPLPWQ